ncbi:MAG: hypothetical protein ACOVLE_05435 [Pirellula staleyi]
MFDLYQLFALCGPIEDVLIRQANSISARTLGVLFCMSDGLRQPILVFGNCTEANSITESGLFELIFETQISSLPNVERESWLG